MIAYALREGPTARDFETDYYCIRREEELAVYFKEGMSFFFILNLSRNVDLQSTTTICP